MRPESRIEGFFFRKEEGVLKSRAFWKFKLSLGDAIRIVRVEAQRYKVRHFGVTSQKKQVKELGKFRKIS